MRGPMDPAASAPDTLHMAALLASAFGETATAGAS